MAPQSAIDERRHDQYVPLRGGSARGVEAFYRARGLRIASLASRTVLHCRASMRPPSSCAMWAPTTAIASDYPASRISTDRVPVDRACGRRIGADQCRVLASCAVVPRTGRVDPARWPNRFNSIGRRARSLGDRRPAGRCGRTLVRPLDSVLLSSTNLGMRGTEGCCWQRSGSKVVTRTPSGAPARDREAAGSTPSSPTWKRWTLACRATSATA